MPWDEYEAEHDEAKRLHKKKKRNDLIVVASLIEKVANMGGLSRTCEIFNASALVLPNKSVIQVRIKESRNNCLKEYQSPHKNGFQFMRSGSEISETIWNCIKL